MNSNTGAVQANTQLDRDASGATLVYNDLYITATDSGNIASTPQQLSVTLNDINDNAPVCVPVLVTVSTAENTGDGE